MQVKEILKKAQDWADESRVRAGVVAGVIVLVIGASATGIYSLVSGDDSEAGESAGQGTDPPTTPETTEIADRDGDGFEDSADACPEDPADETSPNGCPDADNDGVYHPEDRCPDETGPASNNGCPKPVACAEGTPQNGDPFEPNNNISDAAGPLRSGKSYEAVIENDDEEDWFVFCTGSEANTEVTLTLVDDGNGCLGFEGTIKDDQGGPLTDKIYGFSSQPTRSDSFNAKATTRYFVTVGGGNFECAGGIYTIRVDGPLTQTLPAEADPAP